MVQERLLSTCGAAAAAIMTPGFTGVCAAQESINHTWRVVETYYGSPTPLPNPNGMVEPGESALLQLSIDITPGVGSPMTYTTPSGIGVGTVAGFAADRFDLVASAGGEATWSVLPRRQGWALGVAGTPWAGGVNRVGFGQFVWPGNVANPENPIEAIWQVLWTPASYLPRRVAFHIDPEPDTPSVYIEFGRDPKGVPLYIGRQVHRGGQMGGQIVVVPGPAGAFVLAGAALWRRRRRGPTCSPAPRSTLH
jgi:MYXO-CTERM domain-containing protein